MTIQKLLILPECSSVIIIDTGNKETIGVCPPNVYVMPTVELVNRELYKDGEHGKVLVNSLTASWAHVCNKVHDKVTIP